MAQTKLTDQAKVTVLQLIEEGHTQASAAEAVGVTSEAIRQAKHRDPQFSASFELAKSRTKGNVRSALYAKALTGNVAAIKEWREHWAEDLSETVEEDNEMDKERAAAAARLFETLPGMEDVEG